MNFSFDTLQGAYLHDLLFQPQAVADTVAALAPAPQLDALREGLIEGRYRRIVLTGMGGSCQILPPVHIRLVQAGFDAAIVETSELLYSTPRLLAPGTVAIVVSQSGASAETLRLLDRGGAFIVGVTNTEGSPLAERADLAIYTRAGQEAAVSCKTSVTAMAALEWMGGRLCGANPMHTRADLDSLPPAMEAYLTHWQDHVRALAPMLAGIRSFFAVGRGRSLAAAGLGGMIQKEAAHLHGEGMGSAAFRHGPFEMLGPDIFVLVFEGDAAVSSMNRALFRDVQAAGARAALCGFGGGGGPFALPPVAESVRPILELLPTQMVSLALAGLAGREPGRFERITKVTAVE